MGKHDDVNSIEEIDNSVDIFFLEDDEFSEVENPLLQLNAIVLEMDWEISDESLGKYLSEIKNLMIQYQSDRPIYLFFKLHATIGEYILKKKARAHPSALQFMYSVYGSLNRALSSGIPLVEKNRLILDEINNFKILKKKMFPGFYPEEN